ncbi:MAG TPA: amino acid permease [Blastocatellia bacterium]|nr:amino acid permease [Blastocatellia bacterium]
MEQRVEVTSRPLRPRADEVAAPRPTIGAADAVALVVGIVVGAGIFRTPSLVAANAGSESAVLLAWFFGGCISLIGAMCYAELASAYPHPGGDYHYLLRAFGRNTAFLFAWARLTVIPTGSVALMAFVFGDYASQLLRLGEYSSSLYAAAVVIALTGLNIIGIREGKWTQNLLTIVEVLGLLAVIIIGLAFAAPPGPESVTHQGSAAPTGPPLQTAWGLVMILVLLTYGGWNDAGYITAELRGARRNIARVLVWSIALITGLYLLVNLAYLKGLGLQAMGRSEAVAADLMKQSLGDWGTWLISTLVAVSALTSANATILMGARATYAFGRDFQLFSALGRWKQRGSTPAKALLAQGAITLALVGLGTLTRKGFETMVEYTAPVFWFFFLLAGISLFVLRAREPEVARPFRVPLYPLTPAIFCASAAFLLYSSLTYTGVGALVGLAVLGTGALLLWVGRGSQP